MIGQTLSHYRVLEKLGAGGMGEVYRALDTKLGREVAIKALPEAFARDADWLARFEREARMLASLNHSNIAAIYGLEELDELRFLVLELVPGKTLAERLAAGPLAVEEALGICRQIAEALEAAHGKGIVHRDLKPANIKVTPEEKVKVLDFGLARGVVAEGSVSDPSQSPTAIYGETREGMIVGTAGYMSPEQARGKPVDKRTDIWSFGCVLYETLTGQRAFGGETVPDTLVAILEREPDWSALPEATPATIHFLLRRCLQKDPHQRLHDIADARIVIDEALIRPLETTAAAISAVRPKRWRQAIGWSLVGLIVGILATVLVVGSLIHPMLPPPQPLTRLVMSLPASAPLTHRGNPLALSPDGTHLVYVAERGDGTQLYVRAMDQLEATPIPGTEDAMNPFFSPDGQWVGYFAGGKLKKVSLKGEAPVTLCTVKRAFGASWGPDDTIIFTPDIFTGLWRVPAAGGQPQAVTTLDIRTGESTHRWPQILPGGRAVLFTISSSGGLYVAVASLETGERKNLLKNGVYGRYVPTGHLIFYQGEALQAVPFDLTRLEVRGSPIPILEGVMTDFQVGSVQFAVSEIGSLIYAPGQAPRGDRVLVWVDRQGTAQPLTSEQRAFSYPTFSPDGRRLAVTIYGNVWVSEVARGTLTKLTFGANNFLSAWSPDGQRLAFASDRTGQWNLFRMPADGSGAAEPLLKSDYPQLPNSFSPDGRLLAFTDFHPDTLADISLLPLAGERRPRPFLQTPFAEWGAVFSPDGRWIAYVSNESDSDQVYVRPFPGPGGKWQISTDEGREPVWAPDGRELFYRRHNGREVMAVSIKTEPEFTAGPPRVLFEGRYEEGELHVIQNYDLAPDGQRFVMIKRSEPDRGPTQLNVVLNWFEELNRRVPRPGN